MDSQAAVQKALDAQNKFLGSLGKIQQKQIKLMEAFEAKIKQKQMGEFLDDNHAE